MCVCAYMRMLSLGVVLVLSIVVVGVIASIEREIGAVENGCVGCVGCVWGNWVVCRRGLGPVSFGVVLLLLEYI